MDLLNFITGINEKARRDLLYSKIKENSGSQSYLIVPEQFSFESEKLLGEYLDKAEAQTVEVLGFSRLCNSIFREYGGIAGEYSDDTTKLLLMSAALFQCGELKYYKKNVYGAPFIKALVRTDSELKNAGITSDELLKVSKTTDKTVLADKTGDLATIFELYDALLTRSYLDPLTDINRAVEMLSEKPFFSDKNVYIDNFTGFTGSEYKMLRVIIEQAKSVTVSLCCPDIYGKSIGIDLFSKTRRTASRLESIAKELSVKISAPVCAVLENDTRPGGIIDVEENFLRHENAPKYKNGGEVTVIRAKDAFDEANFVACKIRELAEKENIRWRDVAVIARDLSPYTHALDSAFKKAGIPLYIDEAADLSSHPFAAFISASLDAIRGNFDYPDIIRILKTGILPVSEEDISAFENYCFVWNIKGKMFFSDFTGNPEGFKEDSVPDAAVLKKLNDIRALIIPPLQKLKDNTENADGAEFAEAVYNYVTECKVTSGLKTLYEKYSDAGDTFAAESLDSYWNFFVSLIDKFSLSLKGASFDGNTMSRLFELGLSGAKIGTLARTLDCVSAGTADRMRPSSPKAVFIIGVCDGVFPASCGNSGLFTDSERKEMYDLDIKLYDDENDDLISERMYAYTALTSATEHLYISYPKLDPSFEAREPSSFISEILRSVSPAIEMSTDDLPTGFWLKSEELAFERLAGFSGASTPESEALRDYFSKDPVWSERVNHLGVLTKSCGHSLSPAVADKLFGSSFKFSPTSITNYKNCPFKYFLYSGLYLRELNKAELGSLSTGNLIHFVLKELVSKYNGKDLFTLSDSDLRDEIKSVLLTYTNTVFNTTAGKTERFIYLLGKVERLLFIILRRIGEEFAQSEFVPTGFEVPLDDSGDVPTYTLKTDSGKDITVNGKIDRIDTLESGGKRYVRVVDYKSGGASGIPYSYSDVFYGLGMQVPLYLFSVNEKGKNAFSNLEPAGALYMPLSGNVSPIERKELDTASKKKSDTFKYKGFFLDDDEVLGAMDKSGDNKYLPSRRKIASYPFLCSDEFKLMKKHIDNMLKDMADSLSGGKIAAMPYKEGSSNACQRCPYRAVCRRSDDEPFYERPETISKNDFFENI